MRPVPSGAIANRPGDPDPVAANAIVPPTDQVAATTSGRPISGAIEPDATSISDNPAGETRMRPAVGRPREGRETAPTSTGAPDLAPPAAVRRPAPRRGSLRRRVTVMAICWPSGDQTGFAPATEHGDRRVVDRASRPRWSRSRRRRVTSATRNGQAGAVRRPCRAVVIDLVLRDPDEVRAVGIDGEDLGGAAGGIRRRGDEGQPAPVRRPGQSPVPPQGRVVEEEAFTRRSVGVDRVDGFAGSARSRRRTNGDRVRCAPAPATASPSRSGRGNPALDDAEPDPIPRIAVALDRTLEHQRRAGPDRASS